jgi:hypothetical protein
MATPTKDQEKELRECDAGLDYLLSNAAYFGNELQKFRSLKIRVTEHLAPVEPLIAEVRAIEAQFVPFVEANKQRARAHEDHVAAIAAQRQAVRDKHREEVAARISKESERHRAKMALANTTTAIEIIEAVAEIVG